MWVRKYKPIRPKFCYYKNAPDVLYTVFEIYESQNKIGFWHDPNKPNEFPVMFEHLNNMELIWSTLPYK